MRLLPWLALVACDSASGGAFPSDASDDVGDAGIADAADASTADAPAFPPPPSFVVGDGGVACYPGPTACAPCDAGCTEIDAATATVSAIGSTCAEKTGGGGGCARLHVDVGAFGCATSFTAAGVAVTPAFATCVEDALAALDFRCVTAASIDAAFEAGPCGGP